MCEEPCIERAATISAVQAETVKLETEDARLKELQKSVSVSIEVKLGAMIVRRNMKLGDVVTKVTRAHSCTSSSSHPDLPPSICLRLKTLTVCACAAAHQWDKDKDGTISKSEFRINVLEMGVEGEPADVDALFDSYDSDGAPPCIAHVHRYLPFTCP